jgi:hypothetical protein
MCCIPGLIDKLFFRKPRTVPPTLVDLSSTRLLAIQLRGELAMRPGNPSSYPHVIHLYELCKRRLTELDQHVHHIRHKEHTKLDGFDVFHRNKAVTARSELMVVVRRYEFRANQWNGRAN